MPLRANIKKVKEERMIVQVRNVLYNVPTISLSIILVDKLDDSSSQVDNSTVSSYVRHDKEVYV